MNVAVGKVLLKVQERLNKVKGETFNKYKSALIKEIKQNDDNLESRADRVFKEIIKGTKDFKRKNKLLAQTSKTTLKCLKRFFTRVFIEKPSRIGIEVDY